MAVPFILVVDDQPINVQLLKRKLEREGIRIAAAYNGLEALESVKREKPDLILLDVMMPDMDGIEVCERLQANDDTRGIPVIFITARTTKASKLEGLSVGAVDYITKPIDLDETLATARKLLLRVPGRVGLGRGAGTGCEGVWQALAGLHDDGAADTVGPGDGFVVCREKGAAERFVVLFNPAQPGGARDVPKVNVAINDGRRLVGTGQCDEAEPAEDVCADAAHAMNSLMGPV